MVSPFEREAAFVDAAASCLNYALQRIEERHDREGVAVLTLDQRMVLLKAKSEIQKVADALYAMPLPEPERETT